MWSFFSKDGSKESLYEIEKKVTNFDNESLFILFQGKIKSNGKVVSIFKFDSAYNSHADKVACAKGSIKRLKTLRHPSIISIIDSNEDSNDIFFVTEFVIPLKMFLDENLSSYNKEQKYYTASYGLCQISIGLNFLNMDCNLIHNNININSIFVSNKSNWKIGFLDYVTDVNEVWPNKFFDSLKRYDPPEKKSNKKSTKKWSKDIYGLGCLIYEFFCGSIETNESLKNSNRIPNELHEDYLQLINQNPNSRPSFNEFISSFKANKDSMRNKFVQTLFFLDEIEIKDQNEKTVFFTSLIKNIDHFPPLISKKKILPKILESLSLNIDTAILLETMLKIGKSLSNEKYEKEIVPVIIKLFNFKDRVTRAKLLQNIELYIEHIKPKVLNELYLNISQGFLDSNPTIREQTVKSVVHLAPKLNNDNLNDNLLKNILRIQVRDSECSIRANATVCLTKIACYFSPETRKKFIVTSLTRSLRDPFLPSRLAAINALRSTQMFFSLQSIATQVMPALCLLTIDQEKKVRDEAFKLINEFLDKVKKVSEDPSTIEEIEAELDVCYSDNKQFSNNIASAWASWAVSSFTSKLSKISKNTGISEKNNENSDKNNENSKKINKNINQLKNLNLTDKPEESFDSLEEKEFEEKEFNKESKEKKVNKDSIFKSKKFDNFDYKDEEKSGWEIEDENVDFYDETEIKKKPISFDQELNEKKNINTSLSSKKTLGSANETLKTNKLTDLKSTKKTLEDELFESLAEPSNRKVQKKRGAMKLGAQKK